MCSHIDIRLPASQSASLLGLLACLYVSFYMCLFEYCGRNIVMNFFFVIGLFVIIEMRWNVLFRMETIDEIYSFYYCCYNISVIRSAVTNSIFSISFNFISLKLTFVGQFTLFRIRYSYCFALSTPYRDDDDDDEFYMRAINNTANYRTV